MPHDVNNNELKVGDVVNVQFKIKRIHLSEEFCNVDLESTINMYPSGNPTSISINSRQTERK